MTGTTVSGSQEGETTAKRLPSFKCEICEKEFASEAQLAFHKDIEHVKHLPLSGVA